jgi:hypothetical protein
MKRRDVLRGLSAGAGLVAMGKAGSAVGEAGSAVGETAANTVFELRVYHAVEGKLDDLLARFRDHTVAIFARHGMVSVAYWTPLDEPLRGHTLFYVLKHPSRDAATANWAAFRADPEWVKVRTASEERGKIVEKVDSTFMKLTDFSPKI